MSDAWGWSKGSAVLLGLLATLVAIGCAGDLQARPPELPPSKASRLAGGYGRLPLSFEPNRGQADRRVRFISHANGATWLLSKTDGLLLLRRKQGRSTLLRTTLVGASPAQIVPRAQLPGHVNYILGNDPSRWKLGIPTYARLVERDVYPGVDLAYHGNGGRLEYDFLLDPGVDPGVIALSFPDVPDLRLDRNGDLRLRVSGGELREQRPVAYQVIDGRKHAVAARFQVAGGLVGFAVGKYDRRRPLVIDPTLVYSTYLGGTGSVEEAGNDIAVDPSGNAYVTGRTASTGFPTASAARPAFSGGTDAFVSKLNASGTALVYSTYLGGSPDPGDAIGAEIDDPLPSGTGSDWALDPDSSTPGCQITGTRPSQTLHCGPETLAANNIIFARVTSTTSADACGTYVNTARYTTQNKGSGQAVASITCRKPSNLTLRTTGDPFGAVAAGGTIAFTITLDNIVPGLAQATGVQIDDTLPSGTASDWVIASSSDSSCQITGSQPSQSLHCGPETLDVGHSIMVRLTSTTSAEACGSYVNRATYSSGNQGSGQAVASITCNKPSTLEFSADVDRDSVNAGEDVGLRVRLANDTPIQQSFDAGEGIAVDAAGNAYVTGTVNSTDFPTLNARQAACAEPIDRECHDAFVAKLGATGTLVYSTYLGGSSDDSGADIAVDTSGDAYVTGATDSTEFPVFNPLPGGGGGQVGAYGFVSKLNPAGSGLVYSTYLGGIGKCVNNGSGIALDAANSAYVTGTTNCASFPTTANAFQTTIGGTGPAPFQSDGFVSKLSPSGSSLQYSSYLGGSSTEVAEAIAVDSSGSAYVTGWTIGSDFPAVNPLPDQASCTLSGGGTFCTRDAFVSKFSPDGSALRYSTYLGGLCNDDGHDVAVDPTGAAYITGETCSLLFGGPDFPGVNPLQGPGGDVDAFVTKLQPSGNAYAYSTHLGGCGSDAGYGIAAGSDGSAYVTGFTTSPNFPTRNALQPGKAGGSDAFVTKLSAANSFVNVSCVTQESIKVVKRTVPPGSDQPFTFLVGSQQLPEGIEAPFQLKDGQSQTAIPGVGDSGPFFVRETATTGWDTTATCDDGSPIDSISLSPGETVICTFTNTLRSGTVAVTKSCPTGPAAAGDRFQLTNNGFSTGAPLACGGALQIAVQGGVAYSIDEQAAGTTNLANYSKQLSAGCSGTVAPGGSTSCIITNTLKPQPKVTVSKSCPNGAAASGDRFQLTVNGQAVGGPLACGGSLNVSVAAGSAYAIDEQAAGTTNVGSYTKQLSAGCAGMLGFGATAGCTITNTLRTQPKVTVTKSCPNGAAASGDRFQLTVNGQAVGSPLACGSSLDVTVTAGSAYAIEEQAAGTTNLGNYSKQLSAGCAGTLGFGGSAGCTITNSRSSLTCKEDPSRASQMSRTVDPSGLQHGIVPNYLTVQAAYDAAATSGEVIGLFGNTTENVVLGGSKTLVITQCTSAKVTAADNSKPVWDIRSSGKLTIVSPDSYGGTVGWLVETNGQTMKSVRASNASQYGIRLQGSSGSVSYNSVSGSPVGIRIDGSSNDVRGGTVSGNTTGVEIAAGASANTFGTANVGPNTMDGIDVYGSGNTVSGNNRINGNGRHGVLVAGSNNTVKNNSAYQNAADGFKATGSGTTFDSNTSYENTAAGFDVAASATGTKLKANQSNKGSSGSATENGGAEYLLGVAATNQGSNKADAIAVPKTSSPTKCPTFPAAGVCE